jgi:hypothetical protein
MYSVGVNQAYGTVSFSQNNLVAVPLAIASNYTFTGVQVASLTTSAGNQARVGIYSNTNGAPDALLYDSGAFATTPAAFHGVAGASIPLTAGVVWLAIVVNNLQSFRSNLVGGDMASWMTGENAAGAGSTPASGVNRSFTFGALPNPFGSATVNETVTPRVWLLA